MKLSLLHECTTTGAIAATFAPLYFKPKKRKKKLFHEEEGYGYLSITPIKQPMGLGEKKITQESATAKKSGYLGISDQKQTSQPKTKVWQPFEKVGKFKKSSVGGEGVKGHGYDAPGTGTIARDPMGKIMTGTR